MEDMVEEEAERILSDEMTATVHLKDSVEDTLEEMTSQTSITTDARSTRTTRTMAEQMLRKGAGEAQKDMILACKTNEVCKDYTEMWYLDSRNITIRVRGKRYSLTLTNPLVANSTRQQIADPSHEQMRY